MCVVLERHSVVFWVQFLCSYLEEDLINVDGFEAGFSHDNRKPVPYVVIESCRLM